MGRDLADAFPSARRTFDEADAALGFGLARLCFDGPAETLELTEHAQPAILATSIAAHRVLVETAGFAPVALAGHSLGEWTALVASGALAFDDALRGVRERGRLMQAAVPVGTGAMAAIMGLDADTVDALCAEVRGGDVLAPANLNGGGQVVVAGHAAAVDRLAALAATRRAKVQRLRVSAPFHCALMAPAATGLGRVLAEVRFADPAIPVVSSVTARPVGDGAALRALLVEQVTGPVRWEATVRALASFEPAVALEVGPGRALAGLVKRIAPDLPVVAAGDVDGVARAAEALR